MAATDSSASGMASEKSTGNPTRVTTYTLTDHGTKNGTFLNRVKLAPHTAHPIKTGDVIMFGGGGGLQVGDHALNEHISDVAYVFYENKTDGLQAVALAEEQENEEGSQEGDTRKERRERRESLKPNLVNSNNNNNNNNNCSNSHRAGEASYEADQEDGDVASEGMDVEGEVVLESGEDHESASNNNNSAMAVERSGNGLSQNLIEIDEDEEPKVVLNLIESLDESSSSDESPSKKSAPSKKASGKGKIEDLFAESDDDDWDERDGDAEDIEISDEGSDSGMEEMKRIGKARAAALAARKGTSRKGEEKKDENEDGKEKEVKNDRVLRSRRGKAGEESKKDGVKLIRDSQFSFPDDVDPYRKSHKQKRLEAKARRPITPLFMLSDLNIRPSFGGKRTKGTLKFFKSKKGVLGFEYISEAGDMVLKEDDIAHCMFVRNHGLAQTVLQVYTHVSFNIGSKDTQTIQFVHEGGRNTNPREINFLFKRFVATFKPLVKFATDIKPRSKIEFTAVIEHEKTGAPLNIRLQPTSSGLVGFSFTPQPDLYLPFDQIILASFERTKVGVSFDLVVLVKYNNNEFWDYQLTQIPKKSLDMLVDWFAESKVTSFKQPYVKIEWTQIIEHLVEKGYEEFMRDEGWVRLLNQGGNNTNAHPTNKSKKSAAASTVEESGDSDAENSEADSESDESDDASSGDGEESGEGTLRKKKEENIAQRAPSGRARASSEAAKASLMDFDDSSTGSSFTGDSSDSGDVGEDGELIAESSES